MKSFINEFKKSFSSKGWYTKIIEGRVPFKISYPIILALITGIFLSVVFGIFMQRQMIPGIRGILLEMIPADLVVTIKSGELSINKPVPYSLPMPEKAEKMKRKNLVVIDTNVQATLTSNEDYDTVVFANKSAFVTEKDNGEIQAMNFKDFPDFTFTRDVASATFEKLVLFAWIVPLLVIIPLSLVLFCQMLAVFVLAGSLLWVMLKIASRNYLWKHAVTASMYAYSIVFAANLVFFVIGTRSIGFLNSAAISALIALVFIITSKKSEIIAPAEPLV